VQRRKILCASGLAGIAAYRGSGCASRGPAPSPYPGNVAPGLEVPIPAPRARTRCHDRRHKRPSFSSSGRSSHKITSRRTLTKSPSSRRQVSSITQLSRPPIRASIPARNSSMVALVQCACAELNRPRQRPCSYAARSRAQGWSSCAARSYDANSLRPQHLTPSSRIANR
jgi:hypothetical protein